MQLPSKHPDEQRSSRGQSPTATASSRGTVSKFKPQREKNHLPVLLLVIVLASIATVLCYRVFLNRMDSGLRQTVREQLQKIFPQSNIYVGRVHFASPEELVVSDVRFAIAGITPRRPVMSVDRVVLRGNLDVSHYLQQRIEVQHVELNGLQLEAWPLKQGGWSLDSLRPAPGEQPPPKLPRISIAQAIVHVYGDESPTADCLTLHDIEGTVGPVLETPQLQGRLRGRSSGLVRRVDLQLDYDPTEKALSASGSILDLDFSPKLIEQLPPQVAQYLRQASGLECRASSTFEIRTKPTAAPTFSLLGNIASGRLKDPRLPYPLEGLAGEFFCKNGLLQLRSMRARSGATQLTLSTDILGFTLDSPMTIHAQADDLELDGRLYHSLPVKFQQQWDRLQLSGRVSGSFGLSFDGQKWIPTARIDCQQVHLTPWLFPYPLTDVTGEITYEQNSIHSPNLVGQAGGQNVQAALHLSQLDEQWFGTFQCKTTGPVAINEQLINAMTPIDKPTTGAETFVRSLRPRGAIELVNAAFERVSPTDEWHKTIDANIYGGSLTYEGFRYPVYDIRGRVFGKDDTWQLDQFEGRNDSGRILCSGGWTNVKQGQVPFRLEFHCLDVPAEEELKDALPSDAQFIWDELRPTGTIDSVTATVERRDSQSPVDLRVALREESESNQVAGRSLGLFPKSFPYRLSDVGCNITYEPGFVSIISATAVNRSSRFSLTGECRPNQDGRWQADVRWLPTTRLLVDSELLVALPKSIRESLIKLDFSGPVSVYGDNQLLFANQQHPDLMTTWKCQLDIEDGRLGDGKNIGALRGTVWVDGYSTSSQLNVSGTLGMDALTVRGIPVTGLQGPFALLGSELYFGAKVSDVLPRVGQPQSPPIVADALAGKLSLSGQGKLDVGRFAIEAELRGAELTTLLQDVGVDRASTQAKCDATLKFDGVPWNPQTHAGEGSVQLRDAKLYQLPLMMRILNAAAVNASDDSAFQTADITFLIDGDRIPLQIACEGEVLRLRGHGWTNLRREVSLELHSYVGRRMPIAAVMSPLPIEPRYASLMTIDVAGTLDNPILQRRPFPQLEATLQQVFPDMAERRKLGDSLPWKK